MTNDLQPEDWWPTCTLAMLRLRAVVLHTIRTFFVDRGFLEVETPLLSHDVVVDAHLEPFVVDADRRLYLQTSPEAGMKRLLAAGSGSIFQLGKAFRRAETGDRHNPEFTMLEWYANGASWQQQVQLTEDLVQAVHAAALQVATHEVSVGELSDVPFERLSYAAAFQRFLNIDVLDASLEQLQQLAAAKTALRDTARQIGRRDDVLNVLVAECIEPQLGTGVPAFLHDYPVSQAALAEHNPDDPRTALRFELYWNGLELCNGYQELSDVEELSQRDATANAARQQHDSDQLPGAPRMMEAMRHGLPVCSGVALGVDRLLMAILQTPSISDVIAFPIGRA
ncbi:MAG: EF-P lysine aminoacylase EpmA [Planctomycetaceae bacterium]|nr:EF-P lysine aminoacylase EpmA [Planctomycetaceae bacterium]